MTRQRQHRRSRGRRDARLAAVVDDDGKSQSHVCRVFRCHGDREDAALQTEPRRDLRPSALPMSHHDEPFKGVF